MDKLYHEIWPFSPSLNDRFFEDLREIMDIGVVYGLDLDLEDQAIRLAKFYKEHKLDKSKHFRKGA